MYALQFWKLWPKVYQRIGFAIASIFSFTLIFLWLGYVDALAPAIPWQYVQEQELDAIPVYTFQSGLLELTVHGDNYLIFERMLGDTLQPHLMAGYIFVSVLMISMVILLSIITLLKRFWYLIGMGLFILFIASFRMEIVQVFGFSNKIFTILVLLTLVSTSFYFHFFQSSASFLLRLISFTCITVLLGVGMTLSATVTFPLLHLAVTGIAAGTVISLLFILMVAHEIPASFLYIASQATRQTKSLRHFLIISTIYMVNLGLAYAHKIEMIDWDFMYINFLLLLSISGILGVWGFRQRQPQYQNIMAADPFGVFAFLCLGTICFSTIGYFIATANDPALAAINDIIIYSHLGYGLIFITYVISNFFGMLGDNLPVYRILYKPTNMPYFTFRLGGLIATLAFVFYNTWQVPLNNAKAGYYNAGGDLYMAMGNQHFAEAFYQQAGLYGFLNHHANYALANIEGEKRNTFKERNFYKRASERNPTENALLNFSQTYQREGLWLDALLALKEAKIKFPDSGPINNSLGLLFARLSVLDSALYFLQEAMDDSRTQNMAKTNFIGVAAKSHLPVNVDSLFKLISSDNAGVKSNALAFANRQGTRLKMDIDLDKDSVLNLFSASLINNYILNHLGDLDTAFINKTNRLGHRPINSDYSEALLSATALALYADGQVGKAFSLLEEVAIFSQSQGKYNNILALWALEQQNPYGAISFLDYALQQDYDQANITLAIALSQAGRIGEAITQWDSLKRSNDSTLRPMAQQMINALAAPVTLVDRLSENEKYLYCLYRLQPPDTISFNKMINQISNEDLKARALLDMGRKYFEMGETISAIKIFQKITGLKIQDQSLQENILYFELELLAATGHFTALEKKIKTNPYPSSSRWKNQQLFYQALLHEQSENHELAAKYYLWLSTSNPFDEEAIIAGAQYIKTYKSSLEGYTLLAEALHVNPYSPKLLKAYALAAAQMGFSEYATSALMRLKPLIPTYALKKFLTDHQTVFAQILPEVLK